MSPVPFGPVSQTVVASTETDALGKFVFQEELSKRNRYEYHVVFDDRDEYFLPNSWQSEQGEQVNSRVKVGAGSFQDIKLTQIPASKIRFRFDNQSFDTIHVDAFLEHRFLTSQKLDATVHPYSIDGSNLFSDVAAGSVTMTWHVGVQGDTFIFEDNYVLPHNKDTTLRFTYPRN